MIPGWIMIPRASAASFSGRQGLMYWRSRCHPTRAIRGPVEWSRSYFGYERFPALAILQMPAHPLRWREVDTEKQRGFSAVSLKTAVCDDYTKYALQVYLWFPAGLAILQMPAHPLRWREVDTEKQRGFSAVSLKTAVCDDYTKYATQKSTFGSLLSPSFRCRHIHCDGEKSTHKNSRFSAVSLKTAVFEGYPKYR